VRGGLFFGDQQGLGKSGAQPGGDQRIGGFVCGGHGAGIILDLDGKIIGAVDLHDRIPRLQRQIAHNMCQLFVIHRFPFQRCRYYFHQRQLQINLRPLMMSLAIMGKPCLPLPGLM